MKKSIDNFSFYDFEKPSFSGNNVSFIPKIDLNKHLHIKNIGNIENKLLFNSLPKNFEEIFFNKKENIFLDDDISDSDNIYFYPSNVNIEIKNKKKKDFNKLLEENTIIKKDVNIKPCSYILSDSEMETRIKEKTKKIFFIIKTKKISLFTKVNKEDQLKEINEKPEFIKKKRRRNKEDEIRRMIGRRFFNDILYNKINDILKKQGSDIFFEKIQPDLIYDLVKKCNKHLLNKNLEEILITKELYKGKNMEKYFHNIKVLNYLRSEDYLEIMERTQIDKILKMKYVELFKEYISSKEFVEEIDRLKNNKEKFDNCYIDSYIYYSLHFLENFRD